MALAGAVFLLTLAACSPPEAGSNDGAGASAPLAVDLGEAGSGGELPADLLNAIILDLAKQERLRPEDIRLLREEAVTWPNGALGCPGPGEMYTQAEVPGYRVVLESAGHEYDYRAARTGYFRRCDQQPVVNPPTESTPQSQ